MPRARTSPRFPQAARIIRRDDLSASDLPRLPALHATAPWAQGRSLVDLARAINQTDLVLTAWDRECLAVGASSADHWQWRTA